MANTIADIGAKSVNHGSASRDPTAVDPHVSDCEGHWLYCDAH